ncbi:uncharacterized protein LOC126549927 [Aphis gossypii]|uniref:uncharacterized protein LOC126549927 n=1 Tax=Aphis gossypii TaxID=80765 RepID=UPI00215959CA|nr:uncharacterized protein LOC126549927 [Aphis gossypii]
MATITKRWVIGSFTETNEFSVLPTNWLIKTVGPDGRSIIYCKWPPPPTTVSSDIINAAVEPEIDWPSFKVRLANNGKEFCNFKKAWHYKFVLSSDTSASEVDESKNKKLYNQAQKSNFDKASTDSEESEEEAYNILELQCTEKNTHSTILSTTNSNQQKNSSQTTSIRKNSILEVPQVTDDSFNQYDTPYVQNNSLLETVETTDPHVSDKQLRSVYDNNISYNNSLVYENIKLDSSHSAPNFRLNYSDKNIMEKLETVCNEQNIQRLMIERLLLKMDYIAQALKDNSGLHTNTSIQLDEDFLTHFPLIDAAMFTWVENKIINDSNFLDKLGFFIKSIGGSDPKDHVKRTVSKLFSNEYATQCTWTGRGKGITTKIGNTELIKIIKKVVKDCSNKLITDAEFEKCISDWFRYANTRINRSKTKLVQ